MFARRCPLAKKWQVLIDRPGCQRRAHPRQRCAPHLGVVRIPPVGAARTVARLYAGENMPESSLGSPRDLRRPRVLISTAATLAAAVPATFVITCNVHELGHVLVAIALGWKVERLHLCLPVGGGVDYSHIGTWAGNAQGYAGGAIAVIFLLATYRLVVARRARPVRSPRWWALGFAIALLVGPQSVIAVVEGGASAGVDYTERFDDNPALIGLIVVSMAIGAALHVWDWRAPASSGRLDA